MHHIIIGRSHKCSHFKNMSFKNTIWLLVLYMCTLSIFEIKVKPTILLTQQCPACTPVQVFYCVWMRRLYFKGCPAVISTTGWLELITGTIRWDVWWHPQRHINTLCSFPVTNWGSVVDIHLCWTNPPKDILTYEPCLGEDALPLTGAHIKLPQRPKTKIFTHHKACYCAHWLSCCQNAHCST